MSWKTACLGIVLASLATAAAAQATPSATPQDSFKFLTASGLAALLNKTGPGPAVSMLSDHEYYLSEVVARKTDGQVEVHQHWIDFMTVLSGEVTLTYGGTVQGAKETAPGEMRGGSITGGKTVVLHSGDYLEIPTGVPHLMTAPAHNFRYLVIKVRV